MTSASDIEEYIKIAMYEGLLPKTGSQGEVSEWTIKDIEKYTTRRAIWDDGRWEPYLHGDHHHWELVFELRRVDESGRVLVVLDSRTEAAYRCNSIRDKFDELVAYSGDFIHLTIERESESDLAKRHEAIDNPVPTIKGAPRMYVGKTVTAETGFWFIKEDESAGTKKWEHTKKGMLMWGDIFVPGTHCKPDDSWREMKSIETCGEVDW